MFDRKSVWHSELRNASPLVLKFSGDPMDSKYDVGTTDGYAHKVIGFDTRGDDTRRWYIIESPDIENTLKRAPKNEWIEVRASWSGDSQTIEWDRASGSVQRETTSDTSGHSTGNIKDDYLLCIEAARDLPGSDDTATLLANARHLHGQWVRMGVSTPLTHDMDNTPTTDDTGNSATLEEIKELLDLVPTWEGRAHDDSDLLSVFKRIESVVKGAGGSDDAERALAWLENEIEFQSRNDESSTTDDDLPF